MPPKKLTPIKRDDAAMERAEKAKATIREATSTSAR